MTFLRLLLFSLIFNVFGMGYAENIWKTGYREILVEDTARSEVIYVHISKDPKLKKEQVKYEMLSIGDSITVYGGHGNYQLDSIYSTRSVEPNKEERRQLYNEYEPLRESLTIDTKKGVLNFYGSVFINDYRYAEPIPEIEWTLTDETEEIMGYTCNKATAKWRGREWTAWYSDIPINAGPWKFQGLPGLILKVEDTTGEHSIYAIGTENIVYPIGHTYRAYTKSTREKYNEAKEDYAANAGKTFANSGMVFFKSEEEKQRMSNRRLFHAPIELE